MTPEPSDPIEAWGHSATRSNFPSVIEQEQAMRLAGDALVSALEAERLVKQHWFDEWDRERVAHAATRRALDDIDHVWYGYTLDPKDVTDRVEQTRLIARAAVGLAESSPEEIHVYRKGDAVIVDRSAGSPPGDALVSTLEDERAEQRKLREMIEGIAELIDAHFLLPNEVTPSNRLRQVETEIRDTLADTHAPEPTATEREAVRELEDERAAHQKTMHASIDIEAELNAVIAAHANTRRMVVALEADLATARAERNRLRRQLHDAVSLLTYWTSGHGAEFNQATEGALNAFLEQFNTEET